MRLILTAIVFLFATQLCTAQRPQVTYSASFEEAKGYHKVLELSNGNTALLQVNLPFMISVRIYDKTHRQIAYRKMSQGKDPKTGPVNLNGVYEIDSNIVLFISKSRNGGYLKRVVIDGKTGALISRDILVKPQTTKRAKLYPVSFDTKKDPESDRYFVSRYIMPDTGNLINYFDFYEVIDGEHKFVRSIDTKDLGHINSCCYVPGNKLFSYARIPAMLDIATGEVTKGPESDLGQYEYQYPSNIVKYNKQRDIVQALVTLITVKRVKDTRTTYFSSYMKYFDRKSMRQIATGDITQKYAQEFVNKNFDLKKQHDFIAMPQDFIMNVDNTTTVISEESRQATSTSSSGLTVHHRAELDLIGVTRLNDKGAEVSGYVLYKKQFDRQSYGNHYFLARKNGAPVTNSGNNDMFGRYNQFFSVDYINTGKNDYIIYNDLAENFDVPEKKYEKCSAASISSAVLHKHTNGTFKKTYLFAMPTKKTNTFGYIGAYHYNQETKMFTTVVMKREGRKKMARVAWVQLD